MTDLFKLKRFTCNIMQVEDDAFLVTDPSDKGEFVRWSDIEKLMKENNINLYIEKEVEQNKKLCIY